MLGIRSVMLRDIAACVKLLKKKEKCGRIIKTLKKKLKEYEEQVRAL